MLVVLIVGLLLIGRFYPGSGAEVLDWQPTRSHEVEAQNEVDDIDQMLEAANERRRRRGLPARTEDEVRAEVARGERELASRRDSYMADQEVEQMLSAKNERRRARGKPELSLEEYRASLGLDER